MIGGQALDILSENDKTFFNEATLNKIHLNKTGKLIIASTIIPSCFADDKYLVELKNYGENLGLLFQIADDILDFTSTTETLGKSVMKDKNSNKLTYVNLFGLDKAKEYIDTVYFNAIESVKSIENSQILIDFVAFCKGRKN